MEHESNSASGKDKHPQINTVIMERTCSVRGLVDSSSVSVNHCYEKLIHLCLSQQDSE